MKPVNKLAATVAMAFSIGVLPQANAQMTLKTSGVGDALLFPVFWGYSGVENYFTINNSSDKWIQAHIRFRNGAWCGELLDFDVIFSPGDVFVFRVADVDGDGYWEVDQSLDPRNFQYTGTLQSCGPDTDKGPNNSATSLPGSTTQMCMNQNDLLVPDATTNLNENLINHARHMGMIEVFAEGVLEGMTHDLMNRLISSGNAGKLSAEGQRRVGNNLGTSLWSWVEAGNGFNTTRTANDVGNVLSGSAFITVPGSMGVGYNAEAFINFRTSNNSHRVSNYTVNGNTGVILHNENAATDNDSDYLYNINGETRNEELGIAFNNTWGPTLADGDDYNGTSCRSTVDLAGTETDSWDQGWNIANSICEVDDAIRNAGGQTFTSFYFAGEKSLKSWYFAVFPTKFFVGEDSRQVSAQNITSGAEYAAAVVPGLANLGKPITQEVWDHQEIPGVIKPPVIQQPDVCTQSPCPTIEDVPPEPAKKLTLAQCVSVFDIDFLKGGYVNGKDFTKGRVVLSCDDAANACDAQDNPVTQPKTNPVWPFLGYTFEMDGQNIGQWRSMHR